jgi:hypothetical protein
MADIGLHYHQQDSNVEVNTRLIFLNSINSVSRTSKVSCKKMFIIILRVQKMKTKNQIIWILLLDILTISL